MEVADCGLGLASRYQAVPASLLLTDVSLGCTFEASRVQHAAKGLLEVRRETIGTLQALRTNLSMVQTMGTMDGDMLKMSLGLVAKAAVRVLRALRQMSSSVADVVQRGRQCVVQARNVVAFATRHPGWEDEDVIAGALPAPEGARFPEKPTPPQSEKPATEQNVPPRANVPPDADAHASPPQKADRRRNMPSQQEQWLQNHRLLLQLNEEILGLQRRAREHLEKRRASVVCKVPMEDCKGALRLTAEVLLAATNQIEASMDNEDMLCEALTQHFGFVEACNNGLALSTDLRTQLVRLATLVDSQAVLTGLKTGVKARLTDRCSRLPSNARLKAALDQQFEHLSMAI